MKTRDQPLRKGPIRMMPFIKRLVNDIIEQHAPDVRRDDRHPNPRNLEGLSAVQSPRACER